jgi:hypothetical protein
MQFFKPSWGKIGLTILFSFIMYVALIFLISLPAGDNLCLPNLDIPTPTPTPVPNNPLQRTSEYWFAPIPTENLCGTTTHFSQLPELFLLTFFQAFPFSPIIFSIIVSYLLSCTIITLAHKRKKLE